MARGGKGASANAKPEFSLAEHGESAAEHAAAQKTVLVTSRPPYCDCGCVCGISASSRRRRRCNSDGRGGVNSAAIDDDIMTTCAALVVSATHMCYAPLICFLRTRLCAGQDARANHLQIVTQLADQRAAKKQQRPSNRNHPSLKGPNGESADDAAESEVAMLRRVVLTCCRPLAFYLYHSVPLCGGLMRSE